MPDWLSIGNGWRNLYLLSGALQALSLGVFFAKRRLWVKRSRIGAFLAGVAVTPLVEYLWMLVLALVWPHAPKLVYIGVLAFFNNPKVTQVNLPETVTYISAYALGDCFALESVYVPQNTSGIYKTAFTNSAKVVLNVAEGSYGEAFAKQHGIAYTTR